MNLGKETETLEFGLVKKECGHIDIDATKEKLIELLIANMNAMLDEVFE